MKHAAFAMWFALRFTRWACWIGFFAYVLYVLSDRARHLTIFQQLYLSTELWLYGLPTAAITAGLLELMMREKADIARPDYFHLMPPKSN